MFPWGGRIELRQSCYAATEPWHNPGYAVCMSHPLQNVVLVKFHRTGDKTTTSVHNCWRVSGHHTFEVHPVSFMWVKRVNRVNRLGKSDFGLTTFCRPNLFTHVLRIYTHGVVLAESSPKSCMLTSRYKHHGQNGIRIPMNEAHVAYMQHVCRPPSCYVHYMWLWRHHL